MFTSITMNADGTVTVGIADNPLADGGVTFTKHDPGLSTVLNAVMASDNERTVCPVSDIAGTTHSFVPGSGVIVPWSVMGDSRETVEVCADCAEHSEHLSCENCGTSTSPDNGGLCDHCFQTLPTGEWHTAGSW